MAENTVLQINTDLIEDSVRVSSSAMKGLIEVAAELEEAISDAFTINGYKDYLKTVRRFGKNLTDELLVMQLSFGKMKTAIADSVAPIAALFVPVINEGIAAVTKFAGYVGEFFRGLIIGITGQDALAQSAEAAAKSEDKLASAASKAGSAVRRTLVSFDQLNRLNGGSGRGSSASSEDLGIYIPDAISPQVQAVVDKVLALLKPLMEIDLEPLRAAMKNLGEAFSQMAQLAGTAMQWLWFEVLTPFIAWVAEVLAPGLVNFFAAKLEMVTAAIQPLMSGMAALYQAIEPVIAFIGAQVMAALEAWQGAFEQLTAVFREKGPQITGILQNVATVVTTVWNGISPILNAMSASFSRTFGNISATVAKVTGFIIDALSGVSNYLAGVFTGNWTRAWNGIVGTLRGAVNSVITLLNSMLSRFGNAVNSAIAGANSLSLSIPSWVPIVGGKSFSPNLSYISVPQIPYLAQGAVLPANRPFMAVVGDQRHGTNVEAPLATIEQAVAGVMRDHIDSNMAGHEATVAVLQEILGAVLGIRIGDEAIAHAVSRYQNKMAVMKGV